MFSEPVARPFYDLLGIRVSPEDASILELPRNARLENSRGEVHGGAITTILDAAMARVVRERDEEILGAATVELGVHFLRAGKGTLFAAGQLRSVSKNLSVAEAAVWGVARDEPVAIARATFRVFRRGDISTSATAPVQGS